MADDNAAAPQDASVPRQQPQPLTPITLTAPGEREVVDAARASEIVSNWRTELEEHRKKLSAAASTNDSGSTNSTNEVVLCDRIVLTDKSYTAEAATIISTFLKSDQPPPYTRPLAQTITHADLSDVIAKRMEEEGNRVLKTFCDAFADGGKLVSVDLSDNAMGYKGVTACASVLGGHASTLRELSLCNNGLSEETMGEVASILTAPAAGAGGGGGSADTPTENGGDDEHPPCVATNLTKLHFHYNMIDDGGCESFARILSRCTSSNLRDVRFSATRASRNGSIIANALQSLTDGPTNHLVNLTRLDLTANNFDYGDGDVLARVLQKTPNLRELNLSECGLEDDATKLVCHTLLSTGAPIEFLNLNSNEIGPNGARALKHLVEEVGGTTLRVLHVEDNEMSSRGIRFLARALTDAADDGEGADGGGCVIEDLRLNENDFGRIGAMELVRAAPALPRLKILGVDGNFIPKDAVAELQEAYGDRLGSLEDNDPDEDVDDSEVESEQALMAARRRLEEVQVDDIVEELKSRQKGRGDTAQIQRTEQTLERLDDLEAKIDLILDHLKIPKPMQMEERK